MRVLIAGCGYVGLALGKRLSALGHAVSGLRRSWAATPVSARSGISPLTGDLTRPETLGAVTEVPWDAVVQCAAPNEGSEAAYHEVYVRGTLNLLEALAPAPPRAFIFVGSTSVYGQTDGTAVDESSPTEPADFGGLILLEAERTVLERSERLRIPAWILRAAGIYGPGRNRIRAARSGPWVSGNAGSRRMNLIHRDDLVSAILAVMEHLPPSRILNVCDGEHPTAEEFQSWVMARCGGAPDAERPAVRNVPIAESNSVRRARALTDKRVLADRLRRETGWQPAFPDYRAGYEALLVTEAQG